MTLATQNILKDPHLPTVVLVGRPNVGKSTLFNRLVKKKKAIVEDLPGITRDRIEGVWTIGVSHVRLVDCGGLQLNPQTDLEKKMVAQAFKGMETADILLVVIDAKAGITPQDQEWIGKIRKIGKPLIFALNKIDVDQHEYEVEEGLINKLKPAVFISAEHNRGIVDLTEIIASKLNIDAQALPELEVEPQEETQVESIVAHDDEFDAENDEIQEEGDDENLVLDETPLALLSVALIGRPNVGKSSLLNALLNEERCLVDNSPGTTRDPVDSYLEYNEKMYRFIDTAGIRKRAKSTSRVEKVSIIMSLRVIEDADIMLLLVDGNEGPTDQDAHVAGEAFEKGKAIVIIVNKWDEGSKKYTREEFMAMLEFKMSYLQHCPVLFVSAKTGKNTDKIFEAIEGIRTQFDRVVKTSELNKAFSHIVNHHSLPVYRGHNIRMLYATQVSRKPPTFMVFCNYPQNVHFTYKRYLINSLREIFSYHHVPVRVVFKESRKKSL